MAWEGLTTDFAIEPILRDGRVVDFNVIASPAGHDRATVINGSARSALDGSFHNNPNSLGGQA